jgi:outer membrane protein TolC
MTFDEAVRRAVTNHPTLQQAAAGILRAEAVLQQVRSRSLPSVEATFGTNVIDPVARFSGASINPRTQTATSASVSVPLLSPVRWAERHQAEDGVLVSRREADEARRAVATAAGESYLAIITQRRLLDLSARARDNARTHYEFANQRYEGGVGSRLNALRALQELSSNEARVEEARLAIRRAQEALGVLAAADGPVDAAGEPVFTVPPVGAEIPSGNLPAFDVTPIAENSAVSQRTDVLLLAQRQLAAERVVNDSWKAFLPSVSALFSPTLLAPTGLFANARSWRASVLFSVPLFDSGLRRGQARERQALVDVARAERLNLERQAASEIRTAREAVAATQRTVDHARAAAEQADEVLASLTWRFARVPPRTSRSSTHNAAPGMPTQPRRSRRMPSGARNWNYSWRPVYSHSGEEVVGRGFYDPCRRLQRGELTGALERVSLGRTDIASDDPAPDAAGHK